MGYQMRQFNFFQSELVMNPPALFKEDPTCFNSSEFGHLILGDKQGDCHLLDTKLNAQTFNAYEDGLVVTFAQYFLTTDEHPYLITIGEKEETNPVLKVWDLHKVYALYQYPFIHRKQANTPLPTCIKTYKLSQSTSQVTSLAISIKKSTCSVGFKDGQVVLFNGNIVKDRYVKSKIVHQCSEPITGLGFQNTEDINQGLVEDYLYIVTTREIHALNLNDPKLEDKARLDQLGAKINCSTIINSNFHRGLVVGRDDAIYFYGPDGRGPCLAYEGTKESVKYLGSHLIIVSSIPNNSSQRLDIYDLRNKLIAHTQNFTQGLYNLVYEFNGYFALTKDFQLYRLEEKEPQSKIDILLNQDLYPLALNMSQTPAADNNGNLVGSGQLAEIYRKYGDYLYNKGEFDNAMIQYLNTVGWLEPSYVIRKFLDAQRLHSLTQYLEALHQSDLHLANPDHTTLLINCYTKLKDPAKLTQFIQNPENQYQFDLTTAIQVLQSAQYFEQALYLAEQHELHKYYLKIVMEDLKEYEKGLTYLEKLDLEDIHQYLEIFGRIWLKECGESTLDMLLRVCTASHLLPSPPSPQLSPTSTPRLSPNPLNFTSMFIDHPTLLMDFLDQYISIVFEKNFETNNARKSIQITSKDKPLEKRYQPLFDQLLELYLTHSPNSIPPQDDPSQLIDQLRQKALNLMKDPTIPYDPNQALILCKTTQFDQGIVFLYDRLAMYSEILNYWCKSDRVDEVISTLYKYGPKDSTLYELGLTYFASSPQTLLAHPMEFRRVLSLVEDQNLLMPLQVVQALSKNSVATIGSVKAYLERWVQKEQTKLNEEIDIIKEYSQETKSKREELKALVTQGKVFQHTKCTGCNQVLQLPVVHFLCLHSYHQRCLGENTTQCPACSRPHQVVQDMYKNLRQESMDHATFVQRLEHTHPQNRFELIGEYFSKNVFEMDDSLDIFT